MMIGYDCEHCKKEVLLEIEEYEKHPGFCSSGCRLSHGLRRGRIGLVALLWLLALLLVILSLF